MNKIYVITVIQESNDNPIWNRSPKVCFTDKKKAVDEMHAIVNQDQQDFKQNEVEIKSINVAEMDRDGNIVEIMMDMDSVWITYTVTELTVLNSAD